MKIYLKLPYHENRIDLKTCKADCIEAQHGNDFECYLKKKLILTIKLRIAKHQKHVKRIRKSILC